MKYITPEISWHGRDPVYSVDFQYLKGSVRRLATCGADRNIRIWNISVGKDGRNEVEFLSTLSRHTRTINVVRFSPDGQILASGADDNVILLWKLNSISPSATLFQDDDDACRENWIVFKQLRSHLEDVYDLSWSSDGLRLLSGSVDNTAILWDIKKGVKLWLFTEHKSFVQGVAFDPLGKYLATMSSDRVCRVYQGTAPFGVAYELKKVALSSGKVVRMFNDDTMKSFFRRLSFSPDGRLLVIPAGCVENAQGDMINTTFVFARESFSRPVLHLPAGNKAALAIRFCPVLFELRKVPRQNRDAPGVQNDGEEEEWKKYETMFALPYRMVFAVATENSIILYDTQQTRPFALLSNVHYHTLSDITWSHDGKLLVVGSTDGFCTLISFEDGELGQPYKEQVIRVTSCDEAESKAACDPSAGSSDKEAKVSSALPETLKTESESCSDGAVCRVPAITQSFLSGDGHTKPVDSLSSSIRPTDIKETSGVSKSQSGTLSEDTSVSATASLAAAAVSFVPTLSSSTSCTMASSSENSKPPRRMCVQTLVSGTPSSDTYAQPKEKLPRRIQPVTPTILEDQQTIGNPSDEDPKLKDSKSEDSTNIMKCSNTLSPEATSDLQLYLEISDESNSEHPSIPNGILGHTKEASTARQRDNPRRVMPTLEPLSSNPSESVSQAEKPIVFSTTALPSEPTELPGPLQSECRDAEPARKGPRRIPVRTVEKF